LKIVTRHTNYFDVFLEAGIYGLLFVVMHDYHCFGDVKTTIENLFILLNNNLIGGNMAYVAVEKITECLVDSNKRKCVATYAALVLCSDVLFYFGVEAYRKAPTKKKAIMLFETFCKEESQYCINAGPLVKVGSALHAAMALIIAQREAASKMGFFARVSSSGNRVPPTTLFDAAQKAVNHQGMIDVDFLSRQYTTSRGIPGSSFNSSGPIAKRAFTLLFQAAGFSLGDIGLNP